MIVKKFLYILLLVFTVACQSEYQKMLKSDDVEAQYNAAIKFYEEGDYFKAYELFEKLIPVYRLTEKAEKINFLIAKCYYEEGDYLMAAYYYNRFILTFPASDALEEAYYFKALCYYYNSPKYTLDQAYTYQAIDAFQVYLNKFKKGVYSEQSNGYIKELRTKLEIKAFETAKLYVTLQDYKAAVVALKNCIKDYPDSKYREEILFLTLQSAYLLAENSIEAKKEERFLLARDEYYKYIDQFPQGKWVKDAEKMFNTIQKRIQIVN